MKKGVVIVSIVFLFISVLAMTFLFDSNKILEIISFRNNGENFKPHTDYLQKDGEIQGGSTESSSSDSSSSSGGGEISDEAQGEEECYLKISYAVREFNQYLKNNNLYCSFSLQNLDESMVGEFNIGFNLLDSGDSLIESKNKSLSIGPREVVFIQEIFEDVNEESYCKYETLDIPLKDIC